MDGFHCCVFQLYCKSQSMNSIQKKKVDEQANEWIHQANEKDEWDWQFCHEASMCVLGCHNRHQIASVKWPNDGSHHLIFNSLHSQVFPTK